MEIVLFDIGPYLLEGLGATDLLDAQQRLELRGDGPGLGDAPGLPLLRRCCLRRRGSVDRRHAQHNGRPPSPRRQHAGWQQSRAAEHDRRRLAADACGEAACSRHGRSSAADESARIEDLVFEGARKGRGASNASEESLLRSEEI